MDPLFERRTMTRAIRLEPHRIQNNIRDSLLGKLQHQYEGYCSAEGYIQPKSITILDHSIGRVNAIGGGVDYLVTFQADVCLPHEGQIFRAPVSVKSKIGLHLETPPVKVLLPRDLHIGNAEFEAAKEKQEIEFEVIGINYKQRDTSIAILGKMRTIVEPEQQEMEVGRPTDDEIPMIAAPMGEPSSDEKRVVTVNIDAARPKEGMPKRRKLNRAPEGATNEQKPQGEGEGAA